MIVHPKTKIHTPKQARLPPKTAPKVWEGRGGWGPGKGRRTTLFKGIPSPSSPAAGGVSPYAGRTMEWMVRVSSASPLAAYVSYRDMMVAWEKT
jgi:hypothetical protein